MQSASFCSSDVFHRRDFCRRQVVKLIDEAVDLDFEGGYVAFDLARLGVVVECSKPITCSKTKAVRFHEPPVEQLTENIKQAPSGACIGIVRPCTRIHLRLDPRWFLFVHGDLRPDSFFRGPFLYVFLVPVEYFPHHQISLPFSSVPVFERRLCPLFTDEVFGYNDFPWSERVRGQYPYCHPYLGVTTLILAETPAGPRPLHATSPDFFNSAKRVRIHSRQTTGTRSWRNGTPA